VSLKFGSAVWGVVGMILAVAVQTVLENIEETRPVAGLMAHT
jgi:hypothetical protein